MAPCSFVPRCGCLRFTRTRRRPEAEAAAAVTEAVEATAMEAAAMAMAMATEATATEATAAATEVAATTEAAATEVEAEAATVAEEVEVAAAVTEAAQAQAEAAAAMEPPPSSSQPPSSISTSPRTNYEVFLSFRGPDTRKGFADCLYTRLVNAGITVFRDDNDLHAGEKIHDALVQSIKQSNISIPIISKNYASSRSCLIELAQMSECAKAKTQWIVPIFYDINPSDLKRQDGRVEESFRKDVNRGIDCKDIAKWKLALREIAETKGYHLPNSNDGHEGALIETVASYVLQLLKKNDLDVTDNLVGIEPHVQEVMRKLGVIYVNEQATDVCDKDVHVFGICGMPGIGKTTLARVVYNKIHHLFQGCSFLSNIRENGKLDRLMHLQEKLISDLQNQGCRTLSTPEEGTKVIANAFSNMKVLILLDDVHAFDQIKHLVGNLHWFGPGSRILMTVGRVDVLDDFRNGVAEKYEVKVMKPCQALQLFHKHAFRGYHPKEDYEYDALSKDIVDVIGGLPLAIEVTASFLRKNTGEIQIWHETLERLKQRQENKVEEVFNVSYGFLDGETKKIFLDIACFFIGMDERIPSYMWRACDYYPSRGIKLLRDMCLVKRGESNEIWMHNSLREFGREIVRKEDPNEPQNRSRLWNHQEALCTLKGEQSTRKVEALGLTFDGGQREYVGCEAFSHLVGLRFLRLDQATVGGSSQNVLSKLRWLDWQGCSQISELIIFHLEKLVILDLSHSKVTGNSQVWGQILKRAKILQVLNLSSCHSLNAFPDFRALMNLERLVLERCSMLSIYDQFLGNLKKLVSLNLKFCISVATLPRELCDMKDLEELLIDGTAIREIDFKPASMKKLKILSACQCESLAYISPSIGHLESLLHLRLDGAAIVGLPGSIGSLKKLRSLLLGNCRNITLLPCSIGNLESLEVMDLSSTKIARLPRSVKHLKKMEVLKMKETHLREFPKDIKNLEKLEEIDLSRCSNLKGQIHCDIRGLSSLKILRLSVTKISGLPWSDGRFCDQETVSLVSHLQQLDLSECDQLRALRRLPSSLSILRWGSKKLRTVPDLSYLSNLKELSLGDDLGYLTNPKQNSSSKPPQIGWLTGLANLEILELRLSKITTLPENFSKLKLRKLVLHYLNLLDLRQLPSGLSVLCLQHCKIEDSQFSTFKGLSELELQHCHLAETAENISLGDLTRLELLKISYCNVRTLDGLEILYRLRKRTFDNCPSLTGLPDQTNGPFIIDEYNFP